MDGPVFQLFYASRASAPLSHDDVRRICDSAARHNIKHDVTGAMLYGAGMFVQLLEGDEAVVRGIFDFRVRDAAQHEDVTVLHEGFAGQRSAGHWSMALLDVDEHPGTELSTRFHALVSSMREIGEEEGDPTGLLDIFQLAVLNLAAEAA